MGAHNPPGCRPVYQQVTGGDPLGRARAVVSRTTEEARPRTDPADRVPGYVPPSGATVPAWHGVHRELPYVFAASATAAVPGTAPAAGPLRKNAPARYAAGAGFAPPAGSARTCSGILAAGTAFAERRPAHTVGPRREAVERRTARR